MLRLWTVATWNLEVTHDAGEPEWIDAPVSVLSVTELVSSSDIFVDDEKLTAQLSQPLSLYSAWHIDEVCDQIYITCIDPRGITLHKTTYEILFREDLPRLHRARLPLYQLWYTVDGFYTFCIAYSYRRQPYLSIGKVKVRIHYME